MTSSHGVRRVLGTMTGSMRDKVERNATLWANEPGTTQVINL